jgi:hypothetical protein
MNGAPLPHLPDLIGEEIPLYQLLDHFIDEQHELVNEVVGGNDLDLQQLVGPREEDFRPIWLVCNYHQTQMKTFYINLLMSYNRRCKLMMMYSRICQRKMA